MREGIGGGADCGFKFFSALFKGFLKYLYPYFKWI
jgi:hypothetical protein